MRVKIEYYYKKASLSDWAPFWAKSQIGEDFICTCGESWADVRVKHKQRLADSLFTPEAPLAEEIEL